MINYNTYEFTLKAIESIFEYTSGIEFEVILVDNDSPDKSGQRLAEYFGDRLKYIQSGDNLGTSKAFNLGLKIAKGKYILWLNTDILLKENFIYKLYRFMEDNMDCGICGGNILDFNGEPTHSFRRELPSIKSIRQDFSFILKALRFIFKKKFSSEYNYTNLPLEVGYITGADMMVRKSIFDNIGGFDEDIFMYSEESEFTFRMKRDTNYKVFSVPNAHIYHLEGASFGAKKKEFNKSRFNLVLNGNYIYFTKCYGTEIANKYLKLLIKSYRKLSIFTALLLRQKFKIYHNQEKVARKFFYDSAKVNV